MFVHTSSAILNACRTLFDRKENVSWGFLRTLEQSEVRSAFRRKAMETHPDLVQSTDAGVLRRMSEEFMGVRTAYDVVRAFLEQQGRSSGCTSMPPAPQRQAEQCKHAFEGTVPPRKLEIGGYLYYRGCIPYNALIKALVWQKKQRPSVGVIAMQWGWLQEEQVRRILLHRGQPRLFGERAEHFRLLTPIRVRTLLVFQRKQQEKLGKYFVENGFLTSESMEKMVADLGRHNEQLSTPMRKNA